MTHKYDINWTDTQNMVSDKSHKKYILNDKTSEPLTALSRRLNLPQDPGGGTWGWRIPLLAS